MWLQTYHNVLLPTNFCLLKVVFFLYFSILNTWYKGIAVKALNRFAWSETFVILTKGEISENCEVQFFLFTESIYMFNQLISIIHCCRIRDKVMSWSHHQHQLLVPISQKQHLLMVVISPHRPQKPTTRKPVVVLGDQDIKPLNQLNQLMQTMSFWKVWPRQWCFCSKPKGQK